MSLRGTTASLPYARYTSYMSDTLIVLEPDPVIEAYKKDIDRTLLRERLKRTPEERLRDLQSAVRSVLEMREQFQKTRR